MMNTLGRMDGSSDHGIRSIITCGKITRHFSFNHMTGGTHQNVRIYHQITSYIILTSLIGFTLGVSNFVAWLPKYIYTHVYPKTRPCPFICLTPATIYFNPYIREPRRCTVIIVFLNLIDTVGNWPFKRTTCAPKVNISVWIADIARMRLHIEILFHCSWYITIHLKVSLCAGFRKSVRYSQVCEFRSTKIRAFSWSMTFFEGDTNDDYHQLVWQLNTKVCRVLRHIYSAIPLVQNQAIVVDF